MGTTEGEEGGGGGAGGCCLPEEDERVVGSEGRTGQQGSDEVCLGYFGVLRLLCGASVLPLLVGPRREGGRGGMREEAEGSAGASFHFYE